ncbi:MAG TPA: nitroreductase family protein [Polyangiaceae bacterium]|nr:nitroreductase family protein [Polyangiaceae bacterium]
MNLNEALLSRRAVRAYTSRKVVDETVRTLVRAAVLAPSAMNRQPWLFSIIQDAAQLTRYSDRAKTMLLAQMSGDPKTSHYADRLQNPAFNIFYDASTLIVIGVGERGTYTDADCWLAAANLMLAATDAGLGTCPIGFAIPVLNLPEVKTEIGLPSSGVAVAPILVGYPTAPPPAIPRADAKIVSWSRT